MAFTVFKGKKTQHNLRPCLPPYHPQAFELQHWYQKITGSYIKSERTVRPYRKNFPQHLRGKFLTQHDLSSNIVRKLVCQSWLTLAAPFFFCLQSFLASGPFPMCWLFTSGGQKYWSFSISPSSEYSGLISLQMDWLDLLAAQGLSRTSSPYPWAGLDSQGPGQCVSSAPCRQSRGESSMSPSWGAQGPGGSGTVASFRGLIHCPPRQQQLVSASGPQSPVTVLRVPPRGREEPL